MTTKLAIGTRVRDTAIIEGRIGVVIHASVSSTHGSLVVVRWSNGTESAVYPVYLAVF